MRSKELIFEKLLTDVRFCKKVRRAGRITSTTGHESGFVISQKNDKFLYGKVIEGTADAWSQEKREESAFGLKGKIKGSFHFYPEEDDLSIIPSANDLNNIADADIKDSVKRRDEWIIIGKEKKNKITLLFLYPIFPVTIAEINIFWDSVNPKSIEDFFSILREFSIGSIVINI